MLKPRGEGGDRNSGREKVCAPLAATSSSIKADMSLRSNRRLGLTKSSTANEASISPVVQHFAHATVTGGTPGSRLRTSDLLVGVRVAIHFERPGWAPAYPSNNTSFSSVCSKLNFVDARLSRRCSSRVIKSLFFLCNMATSSADRLAAAKGAKMAPVAKTETGRTMATSRRGREERTVRWIH